MPEMILPGTYIEVRAEGLMLPGPISIGNVGIVGTARRGRLGDDTDPTTVYIPANLGEARQLFGQYDAYDSPDAPGHPLTLIRALELAYANGAQRVFAARVAASTASRASYRLSAGSGTSLDLQAAGPGDGYNGATISTSAYALGLAVAASVGGTALERLSSLPADPDQFATVVNAASARFSAANTGGNAPIAVGAAVNRTTSGVDPTPAIFEVSAGTGSVTLTAREAGDGMNDVTVDVAAGTTAPQCTLTISRSGTAIETLTDIPRAPASFISSVNGLSHLFTAADNASDADVSDQTLAAPGTDGDPGAQAVFVITAGAGTVSLTARQAGVRPNAWDVAVSGYLDVSISLDGLIETWRDVPSDTTEFARVLAGVHPTYNYSAKASTSGRSDLIEIDLGAITATGNIGASQTASQVGTGSNGADATIPDYQAGLDALLNEDVHIIILAGQGGADARAALIAHVQNASGDLMRRERIGIIGSDPSARLTDLVAPAQDDGRLVFVGPGIKVTDAASKHEVTLPGTYSAAAAAGRISALDPQESPTNKTILANNLQTVFNGTELEQLVLGRVLALENRNGSFRIVRGVTTSTNTAWTQITTRRIVDYARFGVRAAANPFIGKLNNERVRQALKGSINSLLADMVDREMLISYDLEVSATRDQQIRGIVQVTMVLRPTFSIDYIRVVMYLE